MSGGNTVAQVQDFYAVQGSGWKKGCCTMGLLFQQGRSQGEVGVSGLWAIIASPIVDRVIPFT